MLTTVKHQLPTRVRSALVAASRVFDPYPYRRYMKRYGAIFVHVPKTGGTAFLEAIGERGSRMHVPWQVYWQANKYRFASYKKFAVVRNPYDRLVSVHTYLMKGGSPKSDARLAAEVQREAPSFPDFVARFLTPSRMCLHNLFRPQAFYVCDVFGNIMVDRLCRFENLEEDMKRVFVDLGLKPRRLPKVNTSGRTRHWATFYTPEAAAQVQSLYRSDFEFFGYSTDIPTASA